MGNTEEFMPKILLRLMIFPYNVVICGGFRIYQDIYVLLDKAGTFSVKLGIICRSITNKDV